MHSIVTIRWENRWTKNHQYLREGIGSGRAAYWWMVRNQQKKEMAGAVMMMMTHHTNGMYPSDRI